MSLAPIRLADAQPGMVVAKAVVNPKGMVLCAEGTVLSDRMIARLLQMDVTTIVIESQDEMTDQEFERRKGKINRRFAAVDPSSMLGRLKHVLLEKLESMRK